MVVVQEEISVFSKMLAAHSSVFRTRLKQRIRESDEPELLEDIRPNTFKNLLRYALSIANY